MQYQVLDAEIYCCVRIILEYRDERPTNHTTAELLIDFVHFRLAKTRKPGHQPSAHHDLLDVQLPEP